MTTQLAVKLPDRLVAELDRLVGDGSFSNRSEAIRFAIDALVRNVDRRRIDEAFAEGFRRSPEREDEVEEATRLGLEAIRDEPWKRWW